MVQRAGIQFLHLFWDRGNLYKRDRLHLNWRETNNLGERFAGATQEDLSNVGKGEDPRAEIREMKICGQIQ